MLISMNWIGEFVDLSGLDIDALIHRFTLSTAEVEEVKHVGENVRGVIVARIAEVENHPKSKKLHLLKVDTGKGLVDVVCGAPNVRVGLTVAFAQEGSCVNGINISRAVVGGYESCGMCCSEAELGISADHSGLMEIEDDIPLGTELVDAYAIRDIIFEVDNKSLTNRPDLWGHYGIAREFAALAGRPLKAFDRVKSSKYKALPPVAIDIRDKENCLRYTSVKVENITVSRSPVDMRIRLFYCGTRAINLLADLTNYIMLELGQPMHAFDLRKVDAVEIQRFNENFKFTTLDSNERNIDPDMLMITSHDEPVCIAGIMGGLASEIEDDTTSLLLESANFDAVSVRKSTMRLGLRTDASMRYEKTLDPEMTLPAIERYLWLLSQIDPNAKVISSVTDSYARKYKKITLEFDKKFVDRYTGIKISNARIVKTLESLGFTVEHDKGHFRVKVPSWRATKDVTIKADIIEEITRIYGYDNFDIHTTTSPLYPVQSSIGRVDDFAFKNLLVDAFALHEVHSYIWNDAKRLREIGIEVEDNVKLINSLNPDQIVIRNCIVPSLIVTAADNRGFAEDYGVFEIGRVAEGLREDGLCNERKKLGIVLYSRTMSEKQLYLKLKDIIATLGTVLKGEQFDLRFADTTTHAWQHPINTANILFAGEEVGFMTALHPSVVGKIDKKAAIVAVQIDMDAISAHERKPADFVEPSKFPGIDIDLSLLLAKGVPYCAAADILDATDCPILGGYTLADIYEGAELEGARSVTVRLNFVSGERTLSLEEVQTEVDAILEKLAEADIRLKQ